MTWGSSTVRGHESNLSHSSDNTRFLIHQGNSDVMRVFFFCFVFLCSSKHCNKWRQAPGVRHRKWKSFQTSPCSQSEEAHDLNSTWLEFLNQLPCGNVTWLQEGMCAIPAKRLKFPGVSALPFGLTYHTTYLSHIAPKGPLSTSSCPHPPPPSLPYYSI